MRTAQVTEAVLPQTHLKLKTYIITGVLLSLAAIIGLSPLASADRFDDKINAINQQTNQARAAQQGLESQEASLSAVLAALQARIIELEANIAATKAKQEDLRIKIIQTEAEIAHQKQVLGKSIKAMYVDSNISTLEMLASSKGLSNFVDKQEYREAVNSQLKETLARIESLKVELENQKATVEKLLADQQVMQVQLDSQRAESSRLLSMNQAQQSEYEQSIRVNNAQVNELKQQQAIENARHFKGGWTTGGTGSYPWANVPYPSSSVDPWGMFKRECVSYTAWKVASSGRYMPYWGGHGNANNWDENARSAGIPVDTSPRVGDVAVSNVGKYGHVMYVEAVNGDGTISISQYNAGWDGKYSVGKRSTTGLYFIHF